MTIKDFISGLFSKSNGGWNYFYSSAPYSSKASQEYYFGIIFSCTDAIAKAVQNVEYGLYKKKGDDYEEVTDHPAIKLLKTPNVIHSDRDFLYTFSSHIDLYGQSFLWPIRTCMSSKNIVELRILNASNVHTIPSDENLIDGYKWKTGTKTRDFEPQELVNILRPDPIDMINGLSTIQKAKYEGDNELNSQKLNASFYENGGLPSGVISTDSAVDQKTFDMIKRRVKQQYEGVKNSYKVMFLTHGANYKAIQPTQRDMEYVSQRKLNRDQILSIFQVPGSVIAVSENSNRAVAEVELRAFMENTVEPRLRFIFDKLNRFYLPMFEGTEGMELRFESVVPADRQFELLEKVQSVRKWRTPNEIRASEGLEPIEGGDGLDSATNFSFNPADTSSDEDISGDDTSDDKNKAENKALETLAQAWSKEKECTDCNKGDHKTKLEELPKPSDQSNKKDREYTRRRNSYISAKEKKFALELNQHVSFLIRDIKKESIKMVKGIEEDFELTPQVVESKILPDDEKIEQWKTMLFLMILKNNTQIWKTASKQMNDVYGYKEIEVDRLVSNFISDRANFTSKSVSTTIFKQIRTSIDNAVKNGEIDLRKIKDIVVDNMRDVKDWKAEQIARTELAWSYSEVQMKTYKENGVEKVKWVCGGNPCEICATNCGEEVELNKSFSSGHTNEPAHINCMCMVVAT